MIDYHYTHYVYFINHLLVDSQVLPLNSLKEVVSKDAFDNRRHSSGPTSDLFGPFLNRKKISTTQSKPPQRQKHETYAENFCAR